MTPRIICPHCHRPIDPLTLEVAVSAQTHYRICPECDEPIVLFVGGEEEGDARFPVSDSISALRKEASSGQEPVWA